MNTIERKKAEFPHQIVERVTEFIQNGDLDGVVSMFHPDCKIAMDPDCEPMQGHDAVRAIFSDFVENRAILKATVTGELLNGNLAMLQGNWSIADKDGAELGGGVSTEVAMLLDNGGWVYYIDCPVRMPEPVVPA